jgi:hypothetical protein
MPENNDAESEGRMDSFPGFSSLPHPGAARQSKEMREMKDEEITFLLMAA